MLTKRKRDAKTAPASINSLGVLFINMGTSFRVGAFLVGFQVSYSCFWRVSSSKFLLQACLHQIYNLLPLVS